MQKQELYEHGPLLVPMKNEYLFRAMVQRDHVVLVSLTCALYQIGIDLVRTVRLTDRVLIGSPEEKRTRVPEVRVDFGDGSKRTFLLSLEGVPQGKTGDKRFRTDAWLALFEAATWEEVDALAKEDLGIRAAAKTARELLSDADVVRECLKYER